MNRQSPYAESAECRCLIARVAWPHTYYHEAVCYLVRSHAPPVVRDRDGLDPFEWVHLQLDVYERGARIEGIGYQLADCFGGRGVLLTAKVFGGNSRDEAPRQLVGPLRGRSG